MAIMANRKSLMTLFSDPSCPYSHRTRIVLAEKGVAAEVVSVDPGNIPEDLMHLNPYGSVPALVDRDLVLYDSRVIMEYLDERFPHPPLMPVDPVSRARVRLALYRIDRDWYSLVEDLESTSEKKANKARKMFRESLIATSDVFTAKPFFLSDEFSVVDCCVAPILWRLPHYGIALPARAQPVVDYAQRIFRRASFRSSLSELECEFRE
jgi:Glutathione S-transferase